MSTPILFEWIVVVCIGVPSVWRNPTAAALVMAKIATAIYAAVTDATFTQLLRVYPFFDVFVIAVIASKCPRSFLDCSPADRAVALIFLMMWPLYVAPIHEYYIWWPLWGGVILQFLFASAETLEIYWRQRAMRKSVPPIIDRHLVVMPFRRREAEAVRIAPVGAMLIARRGYG